MYGPCYTCRQRRIQCSGLQRPCAKCVKAGLECLEKRPVRWVKGVAIRGKMRGVSLEDGHVDATGSNNLKQRVKHTKSPIEPSACVIRRDVKYGEFGIMHFDHSSPNLPVVLGDPSISNLNEAGKYYLGYYNGHICKLFIVYDSEENPFRSLIALALEDPILLQSVLALAACHKANTGRSFHQSEMTTSVETTRAQQDALSFKCRAMKELSSALHEAILHRRDSTVASIFLLIFLDLLESGSDRWNFHLEGAKRLMSAFQVSAQSQNGIGQDPGRTLQRIRSFITKQIYLIETLGATFVRPKLISQYSSSVYPDISLQETVEQSFLGCPGYLLSAIQFFSLKRDIIASSEPFDQGTLTDHIQDIGRMLESIRNFDYYAWVSSLPQSHHSPDRDVSRLCILSESYKTGALIYGERVLDAFAQRTTTQDHLVWKLIGLIGILKDDRTLLKCALWPICIAGLECRWQAQRDFLIGCLEKFWEDTSCLNVINAAKILQTYWRHIDGQGGDSSQWIFTIGCLGADWLLI